MSNAIFIDVGNLNVLFKVNGKFCLGLSYLNCPEKLLTDAQSLGASFDVYLSMWPRVVGEGDTIINGLSIGGVPFVVLKDEVYEAFLFASRIPGVNDIYLCNALANFVLPARVKNFQSVVCYGQRFALIDVKDSMPEKLQVFDNPNAFYEKMGDDFSCYGDVDIVDVDIIRAQYPELSEFKKNVLVPLTPLIVSYRSAYKEVRELVFEELQNVESQPEPVVEEPKEEAPMPELAAEEVEAVARVQAAKGRIDWVSLGLGAVVCVAMLLLGIGYSMRDVSSQIAVFRSQQQRFQVNSDFYAQVGEIYKRGYDTAGTTANMLQYAKQFELGVNIASVEVTPEQTLLIFNCSSSEIRDQFRTYMELKYTVVGVNDYDAVTAPDGSNILRCSVAIVV